MSLFEESNEPLNLSPTGEARRREMLTQLQHAVVHRRRMRTTRNWTGLAGILAVIVLSIFLFSNPKPETTPIPQTHPESFNLSHIQFENVQNRPGIVERYQIKDQPIRPGVQLNDTELLEVLAAANRPTGLIRVGNEVFLTNDVVDKF